MPSNQTWKRLCLAGLTVLLSTSLVGCGEESKEQESKVEKAIEQEIFFEEKSVEIDYEKSSEEILANYTEKGMNLFKVNFPDTLSMNYALKHIGKEAPEITGKTMDGKEVKLSELEGKNILVSFNKTTCSVCKEMSPIVEGIAIDNKDLVILNVFPVDSNKDIETHFKELKQAIPTYTLSLENNEHLKDLAVKDYRVEQVPTYVFIDKTGKISYTYIGNKDKIMFQDMVDTAFGKEKLYDNMRTVTIRVDKDGNEIVEEKLINENKINEDGVDHTATDVEEAKKKEEKKEDGKAEDKTSDDKPAKEESKEPK